MTCAFPPIDRLSLPSNGVLVSIRLVVANNGFADVSPYFRQGTTESRTSSRPSLITSARCIAGETLHHSGKEVREPPAVVFGQVRDVQNYCGIVEQEEATTTTKTTTTGQMAAAAAAHLPCQK